MDRLLIVSSVIAFALGWAICYILIPLVNQYRKTHNGLRPPKQFRP